MSEWAKRIKLYVDVDAAGGSACLLEGASSSDKAATPSFIACDAFDLQLWFRQKSTSPIQASTSLELPSGDSIVVSGKTTSGLKDGDPLFEVTDFEKVTAGDDTYYHATCNLNTAEIVEAMASLTGNTLPITIDIEVESENNSERLTFQFSANLKRQAYDGEGAPAPIPTPSAGWRTHNGDLQLTNITTGLWHTIYLEGASGAGEVKFGEGEEE